MKPVFLTLSWQVSTEYTIVIVVYNHIWSWLAKLFLSHVLHDVYISVNMTIPSYSLKVLQQQEMKMSLKRRILRLQTELWSSLGGLEDFTQEKL